MRVPVLALVFLGAIVAADEKKKTEAPPVHRRVLVELFTSQG
ncbi:MAG: hypothetical protein ACYTGZ_02910 [Planctomycetota bacterium]|jgi:hypothetical protein